MSANSCPNPCPSCGCGRTHVEAACSGCGWQPLPPVDFKELVEQRPEPSRWVHNVPAMIGLVFTAAGLATGSSLGVAFWAELIRVDWEHGNGWLALQLGAFLACTASLPFSFAGIFFRPRYVALMGLLCGAASGVLTFYVLMVMTAAGLVDPY